ncbi:MAG: hypothetical protein WC869_02110 [Phycisphaerae bacterium]
MDILIQPILESLIDDEDDLDENDEDAVAFEQGFDSWTEEVEPGQTFEIPEDHEGVLPEEMPVGDDGDYSSVLGSGTYRLSEDGTSVAPCNVP